MVRELWTDILPRYLTFISHITPILKETLTIIRELDKRELLNLEKIEEIREEEEKRNIRTVRRLTEFLAMFRSKVYSVIKEFILLNRNKYPLQENESVERYELYKKNLNEYEFHKEDMEEFESQKKTSRKKTNLKNFIIEYLSEVIDALEIMSDITNADQSNYKKSYLYLLVKLIEGKIFPRGGNLHEIYNQLIKNSAEFYECQRHILQPHTYYREDIDNSDFFVLPGMTPKVYQIINNITSLFNLDPSFGKFPERPGYEIPMIIKDDVFMPYIDSIANEEEEGLEAICERIGLRIIDGIFISPKEEFVDILIDNYFLTEKSQPDGIIRLLPKFSNETLVLYYLAFASFRRGFLSKEFVNWISMNFGFLIYNSILKWKLSEENIFYDIFRDLQTNEKILPYLMKLICFPKYLGLDRMKIRDSPQYRKEIFNFLGSQIDNLEDLMNEIVNYLKKLNDS